MSWNHSLPISTIATRLKCLYFQFYVPVSIPQRTLLFSLSISRHDRCLVTYSHGVTQRAWCLRNASQAPALRLGTGPTFVGHWAVEVQETALFCHGPFTDHWTSLFIVVNLFTVSLYMDIGICIVESLSAPFLSIAQKTKFTVYLSFKASMSVLYLTMNELNIIRHFSIFHCLFP